MSTSTTTPLTASRMASKAGATELPGGQWLFANTLQLAIFRHYCNVQARYFATQAEPPRPLATLHVDGAEVRVDWHRAAPIEGEVEVYDRPATAPAPREPMLPLTEEQVHNLYLELSAKVTTLDSPSEMFTEIVRDVERAIASTAARSSWLPIETAPKDGTIFLISYGPTHRLEGSRRVYEARWHESQAKFTSVNGFLLFDGANYWQALPAAPDKAIVEASA